MSSVAHARPTTSKAMLWTGRVISGIVVLMLLFSGIMKIAAVEEVGKEFTRLGYAAEGISIRIGVIEIICALIYAFPQTAVLGAILLTGYLGGATASHVRLSEAFIGPVIGGVLVWLGLFLRDARVRAILPWRS